MNLIGTGDTPHQQQQKLLADLSASKPMICPHCGYDVFLPAIKLRKLSKMLTGSTVDSVIPIDCFVCGNCGMVNEELLPPKIREMEKVEKQKLDTAPKPDGPKTTELFK